MTWDDIDDVIFEGTKEEVDNLKCPRCGHSLDIEFSNIKTLTIRCRGCGIISRSTPYLDVPKYLQKNDTKK